MVCKILKFIIIPIALFYFIGCSYNLKNQIAPIESIKKWNDGAQKDKPTIFLDFKTFQGKPDSESLRSLPVSQVEEDTIVRLIESANIFSEVIYDEYEKDRADIVVKIEHYRYTEGKNGLKGLVTAFSFFIIPSYYDFIQSISTKAYDQQGNLLYEHRNEDGIRFWMGLVAPFLGTPGFPAEGRIKYTLLTDSVKNIALSNKFQTTK